MRKIIKLFKIEKEYAFSGTLVDFNEKVRTFKSINVELLSENEIKFSSQLSLGTMISNIDLFATEDINIRATISEFDAERLRIKLSSKIRFEHYFIAFMFILFLVFSIVEKESIWLLPSLLALWIIFHSWFQYIYRSQENQTIHTVVSKLNLKRFK
jgi:hypothetical protein